MGWQAAAANRQEKGVGKSGVFSDAFYPERLSPFALITIP
jgi:hypothetical protein